MLRVRQVFFGAGLFGAAVLLSIGFSAASVQAK